MKLGFQFKKNSLPQLESLNPKIFDIGKYWYIGLGISFVVFALTAFIGFKLFYSQYFGERYSGSSQSFENILNVNRLKATIEKRNSFINEEPVLPRDPSL